MSEIQLVQLTLFLPENLSGLEKKELYSGLQAGNFIKKSLQHRCFL